jgi:hypothetical protein
MARITGFPGLSARILTSLQHFILEPRPIKTHAADVVYGLVHYSQPARRYIYTSS